MLFQNCFDLVNLFIELLRMQKTRIKTSLRDREQESIIWKYNIFSKLTFSLKLGILIKNLSFLI